MILMMSTWDAIAEFEGLPLLGLWEVALETVQHGGDRPQKQFHRSLSLQVTETPLGAAGSPPPSSPHTAWHDILDPECCGAPPQIPSQPATGLPASNTIC